MKIQQNVSLAEKNWFRTGGNASFYAEPEQEVEVQELLLFASKKEMPTTVIGQGANILISDEGISGLVISPQLDTLEVNVEHNTVTAGAGISMERLIQFSLDCGLVGLEVFSGIPGTVGGAVFINLHYFSSLIQHFLSSARVIEVATGKIIDVDVDWFRFGYNDSRLHDRTFYLLQATFLLSRASSEKVAYAQGRRVEIINHRQRRYPPRRTCGSFFRNFFSYEVEKCPGKVTHVAYYLDVVGARRHNASTPAYVSFQHANMIVSKPGAITADIIAVARMMQQRVYEEFGVIPQPECRLLGFSRNPLL